MTEWKCSSADCPSNSNFSILISNTKNPLSAPVTPNPFLITFKSPSNNEIYNCGTTLNALPDLEIGPIFNLQITHFNTPYTLHSTNYNISFATSASISTNGYITLYFPPRRIKKSAT